MIVSLFCFFFTFVQFSKLFHKKRGWFSCRSVVTIRNNSDTTSGVQIKRPTDRPTDRRQMVIIGSWMFYCLMKLLLLLLFFHSLIYGPYLLPIRHAWFVESHEVDLTRWSTFGTAEEYFVIAFAQKLQTLRFFMHEDTI